jgi:SH3-like domain-containing protein
MGSLAQEKKGGSEAMKRSASHRLAATTAAVALLLSAAGPLGADAGDIHQVSAESVNLRAGPSQSTAVRGRVGSGTEVLELRREDNWVGVRVLRTGEEGWIHGNLLETVARSTLATGEAPALEQDAGFRDISEGFDRLVQSLNAELGYTVVERVQRTGADELTVTPTEQWLRYGSRDAHVMTAAAVYQMWKNHQDQAPVRVTVKGSDGGEYITIADGAAGPELSVRAPGDQPAS